MKELYTKPELTVAEFTVEDVVTTSTNEQISRPFGDGDDDYIIKGARSNPCLFLLPIMCINRFALRFLLGGSTFVRHPLARKRNLSHILGNKRSDNADKPL